MCTNSSESATLAASCSFIELAQQAATAHWLNDAAKREQLRQRFAESARVFRTHHRPNSIPKDTQAA
jgi:hypothetical protein